MVEKKSVRFANSMGKPLVTVREINAVGRGTKLTPLVRKSTPADLKKMKAKHEAAVKKAKADVSRAADNLNKVEKLVTNVRNTQLLAKLQLIKEKNPAAIKNIKEKINKMNSSMKTLIPHLENKRLAANLANNKLKAQKALGIKKSRFSFM